MQTRRRFLKTVALAPTVGITHFAYCSRESTGNFTLPTEAENEKLGRQQRSAWDSFVWGLVAGAAERDLIKIAERGLADRGPEVARDCARFLASMGRRQGDRW